MERAIQTATKFKDYLSRGVRLLYGDDLSVRLSLEFSMASIFFEFYVHRNS